MINLVDVDLDHPDVFSAQVQFAHAGYVEKDALFEALEVEGVPRDKWPKAPTDHVCLGRAMRSVAGRSDRVESIAGGWVLTSVIGDKLDLEDPDNDGTDAHEVTVTAKVIFAEDNQYLRVTPTDSVHAALLRYEFEFQRGQFKASEDLSRWLSQHVIPWVGGVSAKARGGSYYVTKGVGLDSMRKVADALEHVSRYKMKTFAPLDGSDTKVELPTVVQGTHVIMKPEFKTLDAVRITLNGIMEECDRVCDELGVALYNPNNKKPLGKRALTTQIEKADALEEKISAYSKALGLDLGDLNVRLNELNSGLGIALLATEDDNTENANV